MTAESSQKFGNELRRVVDYFREEFEVTYNEAIGVLQALSWQLIQEAAADDEKEETDEK